MAEAPVFTQTLHMFQEDNSLSNLDALRGIFGAHPSSENAKSFLSAAFTFNAEALLRELYSGKGASLPKVAQPISFTILTT